MVAAHFPQKTGHKSLLTSLAVAVAISLQWRKARTELPVVPGATLSTLGAGTKATKGHTPLRAVITLFSLVTVLILLASNGHTADKGIALEAGWASAKGTVVLCLAHCPLST